jgi:TP901-1 family phage major tail protein|tara:strand:- start:81 stop:485 length:405 start_codon:yes stop_codon:yes gene_type:complete
MPVLNGTNLVLSTDSVADNSQVDVTLQSEVSISFEMEEIDVTSKADGGNKTLIPGKRSASVSFSGFLDDTGTNNWFSLLSLWAGDSGECSIVVTDDNVSFSGEAVLTSFEVSAGVEDSTQVSGSFVFNGNVTIA